MIDFDDGAGNSLFGGGATVERKVCGKCFCFLRGARIGLSAEVGAGEGESGAESGGNGDGNGMVRYAESRPAVSGFENEGEGAGPVGLAECFDAAVPMKGEGFNLLGGGDKARNGFIGVAPFSGLQALEGFGLLRVAGDTVDGFGGKNEQTAFD